MKAKIRVLLSMLCCATGVILQGCVGGSTDGDSLSYNPQPSIPNAVNYFGTYAKTSNTYNNTIFQVVYNKNTPVQLNLFNLSTYNQSMESNNAIVSYSLTATAQGSNNYDIKQNGVDKGFLVIPNESNIIYSFNMEVGNGKSLFKEQSTIGIATTNQQYLSQNNYIGSCFNLSGTSQGDICSYNVGQNGSFSIIDLNNNTNLCMAGSYYQSINNPYFYVFKCGSYTFQSTFMMYGSTTLMTPLFEQSQGIITGSNTGSNSSYVTSLIPQPNLQESSLNSGIYSQLNLNSLPNLYRANVNNGLIINTGDNTALCSIPNICSLQSIANIGIINAYAIDTGNLVNPSNYTLIGNSNIGNGFYVDNNNYSYYVK